MSDLETTIRELERQFPDQSPLLRMAYKYRETDPASSLTKARIVMEKLLVAVYHTEMDEEPNRPALLGEMLKNKTENTRQNQLDSRHGDASTLGGASNSRTRR